MSNAIESPSATGRATYDLSDRVAVVTGAGTGIGARIAGALREAGASVCIWDVAANPGDAIRCDVSDAIAVGNAVAETMDRHGRIDILVNNAGFSGPTLPVADFPDDQWRRILDVNLTGTYLVSKAVAAVMVAQGWGRIVNMASLAGKEGTPNSAAYSASKAGVIALTKAQGKELARTGVLVNAIAPAAVETALLEQMQPEHVQTMIGKSPMQRLGTVDEVAELTLWLTSGSCTFNTGAVFDLSGGRATY